ncbi:pentatricopeptide repeat-containing protein At2g15690, mitochondrial-like [Phragmites australis]|uniref:pentatricopeptide repeat-containing protein At2g15690, mitochondrial-like n=1 Tax=Phragmites australis TaxID=29695 RepID=UPI002D7A295D|nr:pentatricopeptide repeat-containing protein At2g15690, mitochondrial-like [Phragmites australis]
MRGNAPDNKLLEELRKVHNFFLRSPFRGALKVNNELLEMYAKCAAMPHARRTFDNRPERNMDSWHIMIDGYSVNGLGDEALRLFKLMKECMAPTSHTFVLVLNACASPRLSQPLLLTMQDPEFSLVAMTIQCVCMISKVIKPKLARPKRIVGAIGDGSIQV